MQLKSIIEQIKTALKKFWAWFTRDKISLGLVLATLGVVVTDFFIGVNISKFWLILVLAHMIESYKAEQALKEENSALDAALRIAKANATKSTKAKAKK